MGSQELSDETTTTTTTTSEGRWKGGEFTRGRSHHAYANLASCLTMLHQYTEAEITWKEAQKYPTQPGADATAAILYAAMGDAQKTAAHIAQLNEKYPPWVAQTQEITQQILEGTHPAFPR